MSCDVSVKNQNKIFKLKQRTAARKTYLLCGQYAVFLYGDSGIGVSPTSRTALRSLCGRIAAVVWLEMARDPACNVVADYYVGILLLNTLLIEVSCIKMIDMI